MNETFKKSVAREYFESLVIAVVLALFIRTFVVQAFKIPTGSMEPNLLIGDHLLVNKFVFGPHLSGMERALLPMDDIERREVIVFKYPEEPERDFIKRVIGLPGEQIEVRHKRVLPVGRRVKRREHDLALPCLVLHRRGEILIQPPVEHPRQHVALAPGVSLDAVDQRAWCRGGGLKTGNARQAKAGKQRTAGVQPGEVGHPVAVQFAAALHDAQTRRLDYAKQHL